MASSIQTGADTMDISGYHDNSAFNFQLKNNISGKGSVIYFPPNKTSRGSYFWKKL